MRAQTHRHESHPACAEDRQGDALRAGLYRLLARLLAGPPTAQFLRELGALQVPSAPEAHTHAGTPPTEAQVFEAGMRSAWHALRRAACEATDDAVDDEYHDLFVGISRGELMPYGSWYLSGFLMSRPLALLRRDLDSLGIERYAEVREPEDHVSAVCEAMSLIIDCGAEVPADVQRQFFHDHLARWMTRFFVDLQQAKSARFYVPVGALGEQFMEIEKQYLTAE
jgi:TorA maturation chaperone TorD